MKFRKFNMKLEELNIKPKKFSQVSLKNLTRAEQWLDVSLLTYIHPRIGKIGIKLGWDFIAFIIPPQQAIKDIFPEKINHDQVNPGFVWVSAEFIRYNTIIFSGVNDTLSAIKEAENKGLFNEKSNIVDLLNFIEFYKIVLIIEHDLPLEKGVESLLPSISLREKSEENRFQKPLYEIMDLGNAYARLAFEYAKLSRLSTHAKKELKESALNFLAKAEKQAGFDNYLSVAKSWAELIPAKPNANNKCLVESTRLFMRALKKTYSGYHPHQVKYSLEILLSIREWAELQNEPALKPLVEIYKNRYNELLTALPNDHKILSELNRILAIVENKLGYTQESFNTYQKINDDQKTGKDWLAMGELMMALQTKNNNAYTSEEDLQNLIKEFPLFVRAYLKGEPKIQGDALNILTNIIIRTYAHYTKKDSGEINPTLIDLFNQSDKTIVTLEHLNEFFLALESPDKKAARKEAYEMFEKLLKILKKEQKYGLYRQDINAEEIHKLSVLFQNIKSCGTSTLAEVLTEIAKEIPSIIGTYPKIQKLLQVHNALIDQEEVHKNKRQKVA